MLYSLIPDLLAQAAPVAPLAFNHWQEIYAIFKALAVGLPILWLALQIIKFFRSEKTTISESALRESQTIKSMIASSEKEFATLTAKINTNKDEISERVKESNGYREALKLETTKTNDVHSKIIEDIRGLVYNMRTDIEILKSENLHQNRDIEDLSAENKLLINKVENLIKDIGQLVNGPSL